MAGSTPVGATIPPAPPFPHPHYPARPSAVPSIMKLWTSPDHDDVHNFMISPDQRGAGRVVDQRAAPSRSRRYTVKSPEAPSMDTSPKCWKPKAGDVFGAGGALT